MVRAYPSTPSSERNERELRRLDEADAVDAARGRAVDVHERRRVGVVARDDHRRSNVDRVTGSHEVGYELLEGGRIELVGRDSDQSLSEHDEFQLIHERENLVEKAS